MKKKLLLTCLGLLALVLFFQKISLADDVDYKISRYDGLLEIHQDNTATFSQTITYHFDSDYHGQYVSLGKAGNIPQDFDIDGDHTKSEVAINNGKAFRPKTELEKLDDGYRLKIYDGGESGDTVKVKVTWQLKNILTIHQDIAELNWKPISDGDEVAHNVTFRVSGPETSQSQLFAHLGFLQPNVKVTKTGDAYQLLTDYIGAGKALELHGYWDSQAFSVDKPVQGKGLPHFKEQEETIKRKTKLYQKIFYVIIPVAGLIILVLALLLFSYYKLSLRGRVSGRGPKWLYSAPNDWSPQIVASLVYSTDWSEVNPISAGRGNLRFENMVQASLLDLIDRGNLKLESSEDGLWLCHVHSDNLSASELTFLEMALGPNLGAKVAMSDLFPTYRVDKSISVKNGYRVEEVNRYGRRMTSVFEKDLEELTQNVAEDKRSLGLDDYYRPLTAGENMRRRFSLVMLSLTIALVFISLVYAGITNLLSGLNWPMILGYLAMILLAIVLLVILIRFSRFDKRDGAPRDEAKTDYQAWQAFRRMMKNIKRFDKAQLESIVVWNRILVYATLFGYAKQVEEVLKMQDIAVPPVVNQYLSYNLFPYLYLSSQNFANFGHQAVAAQNFHVSSGGGFSGG
ncbi:DUF2207 domain-containing protein, partial [Streptococcus sobrinus]